MSMKKLFLTSAALLAFSTATNACVLGLRKTGDRELYAIMKFETFTDEGYLDIGAGKDNPSCTSTIGTVERLDHTTYLVQYLGSESCGKPNPRMYQYQCIEPNQLQVTNTENY